MRLKKAARPIIGAEMAGAVTVTIQTSPQA
jgi:hypothetical protein